MLVGFDGVLIELLLDDGELWGLSGMIEFLCFVFELFIFLFNLVEEDFHFLIGFYSILVCMWNLDGFYFYFIIL